MPDRVYEASLDLIGKSLTRYLDRVVPGIISRLDWHFIMRHGKSFTHVLLRKPLLAYKELNDFFGGNKDSVEYFIYFVMKGLFGGDRTYTDRAYRAILDQDEKEFLDLVMRFYNIR